MYNVWVFQLRQQTLTTEINHLVSLRNHKLVKSIIVYALKDYRKVFHIRYIKHEIGNKLYNGMFIKNYKCLYEMGNAMEVNSCTNVPSKTRLFCFFICIKNCYFYFLLFASFSYRLLHFFSHIFHLAWWPSMIAYLYNIHLGKKVIRFDI